MTKTKTIVTIGILATVLGIITISTNNVFENDDVEITESDLVPYNPGGDTLFQMFAREDDFILKDGQVIPLEVIFELKESKNETYKEIGVYELDEKPLIIIPTFTATAYSENGFYDYYDGKCNEKCLTVKINKNDFNYSSSANGIKILKLLGYESITDIEVDKNPDIIHKYKKIILLHNEYVTKSMFETITSHPNVVYLYPNALYAEISVDYNENTISLIRGHGFPDKEISNGFDWKYDNTHPFEFDNKCEEWEFYEIENGVMLNCYPEQKIWQSEQLLKTIKEI